MNGFKMQPLSNGPDEADPPKAAGAEQDSPESTARRTAPVTVADFARRPVPTVSHRATFQRALRALEGCNMRYIVTTDADGKPLGLLDGFVLLSVLSLSRNDVAGLGSPVTPYVWKNVPVVPASTMPREALARLRDHPDAPGLILADEKGQTYGLADRLELNSWEVSRLRKTSRQMDAVLRDMREEIEKTQQESAELTGLLAHDLRGPLGGIRELASVVASDRRSLSDEQIDEFMGLIEKEAARLLDLTKDVVELARARDKSVPLHIARHDPVEIIREACALYSPLARRKQIDLQMIAAEEKPPAVWVDRERLMTVLSNLLDNAVKYCSAGEKIEARVYQTSKQLVLEISDNGQGVDRKELAHLFVRYGQAGSKPTGGESSTGLGLAIAKELTEAHGGRITASGDRGKGLCVRVFLPLHSMPGDPKKSCRTA